MHHSKTIDVAAIAAAARHVMNTAQLVDDSEARQILHRCSAQLVDRAQELADQLTAHAPRNGHDPQPS